MGLRKGEKLGDVEREAALCENYKVRKYRARGESLERYKMALSVS